MFSKFHIIKSRSKNISFNSTVNSTINFNVKENNTNNKCFQANYLSCVISSFYKEAVHHVDTRCHLRDLKQKNACIQVRISHVNVSYVIDADRRCAFFAVPEGHRTNRPSPSCAIAVHIGLLAPLSRPSTYDHDPKFPIDTLSHLDADSRTSRYC